MATEPDVVAGLNDWVRAIQAERYFRMTSARPYAPWSPFLLDYRISSLAQSRGPPGS